MKNLGGGGCNG